ncbi:MAG: motility associated factor glycosyltransferase family protein [Chlamydiota bacterium]
MNNSRSSAVWEHNLQQYSQEYPDIALKIPQADSKHLSFVKNEKGMLNLACYHQGCWDYLHDQHDGLAEAQNWFSSLDLEEVNTLYVYGVGLGYYFEAAQDWLDGDQGRYLVFLEDDWAVVSCLFSTELGRKIVEHPRVRLQLFKDFHQDEKLFNILTNFFINSTPLVSALQYYARHRSDLIRDISYKIMQDSNLKEGVSSEVISLCRPFFTNFYSNVQMIGQAYQGWKLFNNFRNVPAIICGAGPSLNKNFDALKTLSDRALILAGGSAMNALTNRHFLPHLGGGIDPNPAQEERIISNRAYEVPYFYRSRMYHPALKAVHGPHLHLSGGGDYALVDWLDRELGFPIHDTQEGHNVINMLTSLAVELGCNPIIFVGMDLAFTDLQAYASDIVDDPKVDVSTIIKNQEIDGSAFEHPDIYGRPVYTLWKWHAESQWVVEFAEENADRTFVNATEGGIGYKGVPNRTLEEVAQQYLRRQYDFGGRLHADIVSSAMPPGLDEKVADKIKVVRKSLVKTIEICEELMEENRKLAAKLQAGEDVPLSLLTGRAVLLEEDLKEEVAYEYILSTIALLFNQIFKRQLHEAQSQAGVDNINLQQLAEVQMMENKLQFLREAAQANLQALDKSYINTNQQSV